MATNTLPQNLNLGSRGADVSELQTTLKQHGLYKGAIDGVYGPQTQASIKQFQQMAGIKNDGIYGPQTTAQLDQWVGNPIKFAIADPIIQQRMAQNPTFAQTMTQLASNGGNQADTVAAAHQLAAGGHTEFQNPDGTINGDVFQQLATQYAAPQINQSLKYYNSDFQNTLQHEQTQYQNQLGSIQRQFPVDKMNLETQMGQNGNWDSSYGNLQRNNLVANTNQKISDLQNNSQYSLANTARQFENQLGSPAVQNYNTTLGDNGNIGSFSGGYQSNGSFNGYNPMGGQSGTLLNQYRSNVLSNAATLRGGSNVQVPGYNQYLGAAQYNTSPSTLPYPNY